MDFLTKLKNLLVKLETSNNSLFTCPVDKQKSYLGTFDEPKDDLERSYFQYRCQMFFYPWYMVMILNLAALPALLLYYFKKSDENGSNQKVDAVFFADGKPDSIIPQSLKDTYGSIVRIDDKRQRLTSKDKKIFRQIISKHPLSWQFLLKCLLKIRFYSYEIDNHHPDSIIVCNEYSFTSSLLTKYCAENGITHINVMHGEKLFYIRDTFFRFHACYVWDNEYRDLFCELRAEPTQFIIEIPPSLVFSQRSQYKVIDYTYYLGAENGDTLDKIMFILDDLHRKGFKVSLRPHPRYTNMKEIKEKKHQFEVEDSSITIEESLMRTRYAISGYSTVLNQAYHNGIKVVIDDITNPESFRKLVELKYVMLETEHKLLSEILEESR
jgi:hypothetical protein